MYYDESIKLETHKHTHTCTHIYKYIYIYIYIYTNMNIYIYIYIYIGTSQILTISRILKEVQTKNLQATLICVDFTKAFNSIHRGDMEQILLAYGLRKETVAAITIFYWNTEVKVGSPDGDTEYFGIVAGVLQGDTLATYLFIICIDYVLRKRLRADKKKRREGTPQKQLLTPTTPMTERYWQIHPTKPKHYCIVWNEPPRALVSMSMHTKRNICAKIKQATSPL